MRVRVHDRRARGNQDSVVSSTTENNPEQHRCAVPLAIGDGWQVVCCTVPPSGSPCVRPELTTKVDQRLSILLRSNTRTGYSRR